MWPFFIVYFCFVFKEFKIHIEENFPELLETPLIIACSGGVDSVVLVHLCHKMNLDIALAHVNFQLRGTESDGDASFVKNLSKALNIPFFSIAFDTLQYAKQNKTSIQIAARELRYKWFENISLEHSRPIVLTAHQENDSLENFFINASRGTGIEGLTGIPSRRGPYRRPLLPFSREVVEEYANANTIHWREDSSNSNTKYIRNKVRHDLIPPFEEIHPNALNNLSKTQEYLMQTKELAVAFIDEKNKELLKKKEDYRSIDIDALLSQKPLSAIVYGLFGPYGFTDSDAVLQLCNALSGKLLLSKTHILLKDRKHLLLKEQKEDSEERFFIELDKDNNNCPIAIQFKKVSSLGEPSNSIIYVDCEKLHLPLCLRRGVEGDILKPYGLEGSKKLSKHFKDEKFNLFQKESQWLLCDATDTIVWVVGNRADRRFKVTSSTKSILKVSI